MGRAIDMENQISVLQAKVKEIETSLKFILDSIDEMEDEENNDETTKKKTNNKRVNNSSK